MAKPRKTVKAAKMVTKGAAKKSTTGAKKPFAVKRASVKPTGG